MMVGTFFFGLLCVIGTMVGIIIILFLLYAILSLADIIKREFF